MANRQDVGKRLRANAGRLAVFAALLCSAALVWAQSQKLIMPDFRQRAAAVPAPKAGEPCERCGVIRTIREIEVPRPGPRPTSQPGETAGGLGTNVFVGAVIVLPTSGGQPYVGGVGTPEMQRRFSDTTYEIIVRYDNGAYTQVQRSDGGNWQVGDRVRVQGPNAMELLEP